MSLIRSTIFSLLMALVLAALPAHASVLSTLRPEHPRLLFTAEDQARVQALLGQNPLLDQLMGVLLAECEKHLDEPVIQRRLDEPGNPPHFQRMKEERRTAMFRVFNLALAWRLTGDLRFAERAKADLLAAASFQDWYPGHFLNIGEMSALMGIGYDWLYHHLTAAERATIRAGIMQNGIQPGLAGYAANDPAWVTSRNNWNQVCNSGLVLAALAIAEDEPEAAASVINSAVVSIRNTLKEFKPDGDWAEGPTYWAYGATYNAMLLGALRTGLGTLLGLETAEGFAEFGKSGLFHIQTVGPGNLYFNFGDAKQTAYFSPVLFWLGREYNQPTYAWYQRQMVERDLPRMQAGELMNDDTLDRFFALLIAWFDDRGQTATYADLPLDSYFRGQAAVGAMRSSWTDPKGIYFGFKGGDNQAAHGHMDIGHFVLDAEGVRWAVDLGGDDYSLPNYFDFNSGRWAYYRLNNRSHNTLVINNQIQNKNAAVPIQTFNSTEELTYSVIDMTQAYQGQATSVRRGFALVGRRQVVIEDEIQGVPAGQPIRWGMVTVAEVALDGNKALLTQFGPSAGPETLHTFTASADAQVRDGSTSADLNYGGRPTLDLKGVDTGFRRKAYVRFDISSLPVPLSHVTRATVRFKVAKGGLSGSQEVELFALHDNVSQSGRLGENWPEGTANGSVQTGTLTWNNAPANQTGSNHIDLSRATSLESKTVGSPPTDSSFVFASRPLSTFLNFIRADTNGLINFILRRKDSADSATLDFYSKENTSPNAVPPTLTLATRPPGPLVALQAEILEPAGATFQMVGTSPGLPSGQNPNWGTRMLTIQVNATAAPTRIVVALTPVRDGGPIAPAPDFRPLASSNPNLPVIHVRAAPETAAERGPESSSFIVRRTGNLTVPVTVPATIGGTADNGVDYVAVTTPLQFSFPANSTGPLTVPIVPIRDEEPEGDETVTLTLQPGPGYILDGSGSATITIRDLPRDAWRHDRGNIGGWGDAPAGDGVSNLVKYFLGLDPLQPVSGPPVVVGIRPDPLLTERLVLEFVRPYPPPVDVSYRVEVSSDLSTWHHGPAHVTVHEHAPEGGWQRVTAEDLVPVGEAPRHFLRLRLETN